jgi:hypothetical protein
LKEICAYEIKCLNWLTDDCRQVNRTLSFQQGAVRDKERMWNDFLLSVPVRRARRTSSAIRLLWMGNINREREIMRRCTCTFMQDHTTTDQSMTPISFFDDLPDLAVIEIFSYWSSVDALTGFTCLNHRLTSLLDERGFFRHVHLPSLRSHSFKALLCAVRLNQIESLVIDDSGSPRQLFRWLYLPRLTRLRLQGVREYDSILVFLLLHAATLVHLTIKSNKYYLTVSFHALLFILIDKPL